MTTKHSTTPGISPELAQRIDEEAKGWKAMVKRQETATASRTESVARLTFEAFDAGAVTSKRGKDVPAEVMAQGDYAKRFGVTTAAVSKWRRIGHALSVGMVWGSPEAQRFAKVANDGRIGEASESLKSAEDISALVNTIMAPGLDDANPCGKITPKPREAQPEGKGEEETLVVSAANILKVVGLLSAEVTRQWDDWSLSAETHGALAEALAGLSEFVSEQPTKGKARPRSKRTA